LQGALKSQSFLFIRLTLFENSHKINDNVFLQTKFPLVEILWDFQFLPISAQHTISTCVVGKTGHLFSRVKY